VITYNSRGLWLVIGTGLDEEWEVGKGEAIKREVDGCMIN
jgi:hypothetical protein